MKHYHFISLFLSLLTSLMFSCSASERNQDNSINNETVHISVKDFDFDVKDYFSDKAVFKFSDIFSNIEYISLESTENSTIGNIDKMEITESGDLIIFDLQNGKIARFDSKGKFLNQIGCRGKSKSEYLYPVDVVYDPLNEEVIVFDLPTNTLKFYKPNGSFIKDLRFNNIFKSFGIIDKDHIVTFMDYASTGQSAGTDYNFKVYDRQGDLIEQYDSFKTNRTQFSTSALETFKFQNGHLLCFPHYTSTVFSFEKAKRIPVYQVDYGKKNIPSAVIENSEDTGELRKWLKEHDNLYCRKFFEGTKYYVMQLIANGTKSILYLHDKKSLQKKFAGTFGYNNMFGLLENNIFTHFHDDKIYYVFDPSTAQNVLDNIHSNREEIEKKHEKITDSDITWLKRMSLHTNPIIQICTLK